MAAPLAAEHRLILSGQSLGAVFKANGWAIEKHHLFLGEVTLEPELGYLRRWMGEVTAAHLAVHVYVFSVSVRPKKNPPDAIIGFTSDPGSGILNTVYDSGHFPVQGTIENLSGGRFQFVVDEPELDLRQVHDPGKGTVFPAAVSIGNVVYTPNP